MTPRALMDLLESRRLLAASPVASLPELARISFGGSTEDAIAGQWVVKLGGYKGTEASQLKKARRLIAEATADVTVRQHLFAPGTFTVNLPTTWSTQQQYAALSRLPGFVHATPDWVMRSDAIPNDPSFGNLWGMNQGNDIDIDGPEAWDISTGAMSQVVGIIDSGVDYNHVDLYQNIWINPAEIPATRLANLTDIDGDGIITFRDLNNAANQGPFKITDLNFDGRITGADLRVAMGTTSGADNGTGGWANGADNDSNALVDDLVGWNFLSGNNDPMDVFGHGSHVAGTVGAAGNNSVGVVGVNWRVRIMPLKTGGINGSDNTINTSAAIAAINYTTQMRNRGHALRVNNASWGGGGFNSDLQSAITGNNNAGIIFVAAAGNGGSDNIGDNNDITPHYPSSYAVANVISVANMTQSGGRNTSSNFGATSVHLAAPGTNTLSTTPGNNYSFFTGTSMASPHVAGAAALAFSVAPGATVAAVKNAILNNTDATAAFAGITVTGGRLNAQRAISALAGFPNSPAPALAASSDSGLSSSDNITNVTTPTFNGTAGASNTVRLYVNGNEMGSTVAAGDGTWSITLPALADGSYSVTATATNGIGTSTPSTPITLVIDTAAPTAGGAAFNFSTAPHTVGFTFSENVSATFSLANLTLDNLTTSSNIPAGSMSYGYDSANNVTLSFPGLSSGLLDDGNYRMTVTGISDIAGNAMAGPFQFDFFMLYGDANRNRTVNIGDFSILSSNFNRSPRNFGQGDFNYDTTVNIADFSLLASRFNTSLPAPGDVPSALPPAPPFASQPIGESVADEVLDSGQGV